MVSLGYQSPRFNPMIDCQGWKNAREERIDGANAIGDDHSMQKQRRSPSDGQGSTALASQTHHLSYVGGSLRSPH